jgi:hypothetical protein
VFFPVSIDRIRPDRCAVRRVMQFVKTLHVSDRINQKFRLETRKSIVAPGLFQLNNAIDVDQCVGARTIMD